ncbi:hypothetical protein BH11MYX2_BH11MYX2_40260 [soil metagenome]
MLRVASFVCLDAPLVALAWQAVFAHVFAAPVSCAARAALFFTTWGIYLFDRLADAASVRSGMPMSGRQLFARAHGRIGVIVLAIVAAIDIAMIAQLSAALLVGGAAVGAVCAIYLTVNRRVDRAWRWLPVKELCIGVIFAIGTVAALLPAIGEASGFLPSVALFGALCATNCAVIAVWERGLDLRQGKPSLATQTRLAHRVPWLLVGLALVACASLACVPATIVVPVAVAALAMAVLHVVRRSLPADELTALADLALLVPLIPELWLVLR